MEKNEQKQIELTLEEKANYLTKLNSNNYLTQVRYDKGITLIALVVTIVILLILAGVTLGTVLSDGGLIDKTKEAVGEYEKAQDKEQEELGKIVEMLANALDELGSTGDDTPLVTTVTDTNHADNEKVQDSLGNPLVIPSGFKHKEGTNVEDGIVIEDGEGNEFVWIPVSNIDGDNNSSTTEEESILITKKDKSKVEITLGRYKFKNQRNGTASLDDGTPELVQRGSESNSNDNKYKFNWILNNGDNYGVYEENTSLTRPNGGVGAKELEKFVQSVQDNHGYYLARYEAGTGTGGKPVSKVGAVWNNITQPNASAAAKRMYEGEENYTSDLVNSYAWDTAIVYIQAMGNENYANTKNPNTSLLYTGKTNDVKCNIYDMAGNVGEWTTEYSSFSNTASGSPCVFRGGDWYNSWSHAANRVPHLATYGNNEVGFRTLLYLK